MSIDEARWAAFLQVAGIPFLHKPILFKEADGRGSYGDHMPSFLLQFRSSFWLDVLPELSTEVLPAYHAILNFARTVTMVDEHDASDYWPDGPNCVFVAFGRPGARPTRRAGTYPLFVLGSQENPQVHGDCVHDYLWGTCRLCGRVTLCVDYGYRLGDFSGACMMSCCSGAVYDATRPRRDSARRRRAIAAASCVGRYK